MTITANLADGRVLNFPDGTDPAVIQATVKKMMAQGSHRNKLQSPARSQWRQNNHSVSSLWTG